LHDLTRFAGALTAVLKYYFEKGQVKIDRPAIRGSRE
jgi:hypothetical protein